MVGSERPSAAMNEQQFGGLAVALQEKNPDLAGLTPERAREALRERLNGGGHIGLAVGSTVDGRALVGRSRIAGELRWNEELQSWIVNDQPGRYMSTRVRPNLAPADAARWLANVAGLFSHHLGVAVRPIPYKARA